MGLYLDIANQAAEGQCASQESYADREWDRFLACAIPTPDGGGLYDPINGRPEMPSGVAGEDWRALEHDCAYLGRGSKS